MAGTGTEPGLVSISWALLAKARARVGPARGGRLKPKKPKLGLGVFFLVCFSLPRCLTHFCGGDSEAKLGRLCSSSLFSLFSGFSPIFVEGGGILAGSAFFWVGGWGVEFWGLLAGLASICSGLFFVFPGWR